VCAEGKEEKRRVSLEVAKAIVRQTDYLFLEGMCFGACFLVDSIFICTNTGTQHDDKNLA